MYIMNKYVPVFSKLFGLALIITMLFTGLTTAEDIALENEDFVGPESNTHIIDAETSFSSTIQEKEERKNIIEKETHEHDNGTEYEEVIDYEYETVGGENVYLFDFHDLEYQYAGNGEVEVSFVAQPNEITRLIHLEENPSTTTEEAIEEFNENYLYEEDELKESSFQDLSNDASALPIEAIEGEIVDGEERPNLMSGSGRYDLTIELNDEDEAELKLGSDSGTIEFSTRSEWREYDPAVGGVTPDARGDLEDSLSIGYGDGAEEGPLAFDLNHDPVLQYRFDDETPTDYSGQNNDGSISGSVSQESGVWGSDALSFSDGHIDIGGPSQWTSPDELTITAWIYPLEATEGLFNMGFDSGGDGYNIRVRDGGDLEVRARPLGTGDFQNIVGSVDFNEWQHIAITIEDAEDIQIYVDGELSAEGDFGDTTGESTINQLLGEEHYGSNMGGPMDEVIFFEDILSESDIESLYMEGGQQFGQHSFQSDMTDGIPVYDSGLIEKEETVEWDEIQGSTIGGTTEIAVYNDEPNEALEDETFVYESGASFAEDISSLGESDKLYYQVGMDNDGDVESSPELLDVQFTYDEVTAEFDGSITLIEPNDEETYNFGNGPGFEWEVETESEPADDIRLVVEDSDENIVQDDSVASQSDEATETYTWDLDEDLTETPDDYKWYVEVDWDGLEQTERSNERTFTIEEPQDIEISLTNPDDDASFEYDTDFDFEWEVETFEIGADDIRLNVENFDPISVASQGTETTDSYSWSASNVNDLITTPNTYEWFVDAVYTSVGTMLIDDFEDEDTSDWAVEAPGDYEAQPLEITSEDAISGSYSAKLLPAEDNGDFTQATAERSFDSDVDIEDINEFSIKVNGEQSLTGSTGNAVTIDLIDTDVLGNADMASIRLREEDPSNDEYKITVREEEEGTVEVKDWDTEQTYDIRIIPDTSEKEYDLYINNVFEGTYEYTDTEAVQANDIEIRGGGDDDGHFTVFDDFEIKGDTEETVESETRSFTIEEEEAEETEITLTSPADGNVFDFAQSFDFEWTVDTKDLSADDIEIVVEDSSNREVQRDSVASLPSDSSDSYSWTVEESITETPDDYEWYVEVTNEDTTTTSSQTRSFTVASADDPNVNLVRPENDEQIDTEGQTSYEVEFEFNVEADVTGDLELLLNTPDDDEGEFSSVASFEYENTGTEETFTIEELFENIEFEEEVNDIGESEEYSWKVNFENEEEDIDYDSSTFTWTFVEEQITPAIGIVDRVLDFLRSYWDAFMDGTGSTGKAFAGLILMLLAGAVGYAWARTTGAQFGMAAGFLVAVLIGLIPGWVIVVLLLLAGAIYLYGGR